jgi:hypothetical protein
MEDVSMKTQKTILNALALSMIVAVTAPVVAAEKTDVVTPVVAAEETDVVTPVVAAEKTDVVTPVVAGEKTDVVTPVVAGEKTDVVTPVVVPVVSMISKIGSFVSKYTGIDYLADKTVKAVNCVAETDTYKWVAGKAVDAKDAIVEFAGKHPYIFNAYTGVGTAIVGTAGVTYYFLNRANQNAMKKHKVELNAANKQNEQNEQQVNRLKSDILDLQEQLNSAKQAKVEADAKRAKAEADKVEAGNKEVGKPTDNNKQLAAQIISGYARK